MAQEQEHACLHINSKTVEIPACPHTPPSAALHFIRPLLIGRKTLMFIYTFARKTDALLLTFEMFPPKCLQGACLKTINNLQTFL